MSTSQRRTARRTKPITVSTLLRPFNALWTRDEAFHTRLMSLLAILGALLTAASLVAALVFGFATLRAQEPISVVTGESLQTAIGGDSALACAPNDDDDFLTCLSGRQRSSEFVEVIRVPPASVFEVQYQYKNISEEQQKDVVVRVELPEGVSYVEGTSWISNSNGTREVVDGLTGGGVIVGGYLPGGAVYMKLALKSGTTDSYACGENIVVIRAVTTTAVGHQWTDLPVVVDRVC